ncbi:MAG: hypothetical protein JXO44_09995 [Clostridia bacterium]|nr:hypothetical protein [Clostridia bacterium]
MDWVEVAMQEYQTLRDEILLSFENQQQILNYGIASMGIIIGFAANKWEETLIIDMMLFVLVPILSHLVTLIWNGEINRISRAGQFIKKKEEIINRYIMSSSDASDEPLYWETWLRSYKSEKKNFKTKWNYYATLSMLFLINCASVLLGFIHNTSISGMESRLLFSIISLFNVVAFGVHFVIFNKVKK